MWNLGSLEAEVMEWIWSADGPVPVRDVLEGLNSRRATPLAYTTVMSTMAKLHRRGWLRRAPAGKQYLYEPSETREAYAARVMTCALISGGDPGTTLLHFVEHLAASDSPELQAAVHRVLGKDPR